MNVSAMLGVAPQKRLTLFTVASAAVTSRNDLASQVAAMEQYCLAGAIAVDEWIEEVGGGMNFMRKRLLDLVERIQAGQCRESAIDWRRTV